MLVNFVHLFSAQKLVNKNVLPYIQFPYIISCADILHEVVVQMAREALEQKEDNKLAS